MRRGLLVLATVSVLAVPAYADSDPDPTDVCTGPTLSPARYFAKAFGAAGLSDYSLDTTGTATVTPDVRAKAVQDPGYCSAHQCDDGVAGSLATIRNSTGRFLMRIAHHETPAYTSRATATDEFDALDKFVSGQFRVSCIVPPPPAAASVGAKLEVRSTAEDLFAKGVKGLTPASLGFDHDGIAHTDTYSATVVMGLGWGRKYARTPGQWLQLIPFVSWTLKSVNATPAPTGNIDDLGVGVELSALLKAGFYQELRFYPLYTRSLYDGSQSFTGALTWYPEPGVEGFDNFAELKGFGYFALQPVVSVSYLRVLDQGHNTAFAPGADFFRAGPGANFHFYGYPHSLFDQFSIGASYRYFHGFSGTPRDITNFVGSLNYTPFGSPDAENVTITLKYTAGRDLQSLVQQNDVTIGIGLIY